MKNKVRESQENIFRSLYHEHKGTPMAVSSESIQHKNLRYKNICEIFHDEQNITVHDVGMGLADLNSYIHVNCLRNNVIYSGSEILEEYISEASIKFPECTFSLRDISEFAFDDRYDYVVMSGLFHQRGETTIRDWENFAQNIILNSFQMCTKGIAFNFISPFVDFYQPHVYYSNLPKLLNFINDRLSRFFKIIHNYALFEFTVFVYKEDYMQQSYSEIEFQKYFKR